MTLFHCPYCRNDVDYKPDLSSAIGKPLEKRTYGFICAGMNKNKPHPPVAVIMKVLAVYKNTESIKQASITIFQMKPKFDVLHNFREAIKKRNGNDIGAAKRGATRPKKRYGDPYSAPFKCVLCKLKTDTNYQLSAFNGTTAEDQSLARECNKETKSHRLPITYYVRRVLITQNTHYKHVPEGTNLDLLLDILWEYHWKWESWVQSYYEKVPLGKAR